MPKKSKEKDLKHPELRKGEVFLTNSEVFDVKDIGWKTKRTSQTAYDIDGIPIYDHYHINKLVPVFVQKKELEEAGIEIDGEFNVFLH